MFNETAMSRNNIETGLSSSFYFQAQLYKVGKQFFSAAKQQLTELSKLIQSGFIHATTQIEQIRVPFRMAATATNAAMDKVGIMAAACAHAIRLYYKYGGENNVVASMRKRWRHNRSYMSSTYRSVPL
jgi:hypothetical protein